MLAIIFLAILIATPSAARAQLPGPKSTSLELSPSSFTINSKERITLTATLSSGGEALEGKTIVFSATEGNVSPKSGTADSKGGVSFTYTAPKAGLQESATIKASFPGDPKYKASSASAEATIKALAQHDLTISSTTGGSVTTPGEGTFTYNEGTVRNLVASPDSGCQFVNWTGDTSTVAEINSPSTTIIMNGSYSIIANFEGIKEVASLELSPASFTINSGENITLTATLISEGKPLEGKNIVFSATEGDVSPKSGATDSKGEVSFTYIAPKVSVQRSATINASFPGDPNYKASSASSEATIKVAAPTLKKVSITGAAFAIPETVKDDISSYSATVPKEIEAKLPVKMPSTGFLLATEGELSLVLSSQSDKGLAQVQGWKLPEITIKDVNLSVILAKEVSSRKEGSPASVDEILSRPKEYKLKLVKVNATRRHVSILYDPDDGSGIEFPITTGYLTEKPKTIPSSLGKGIEKGKEIVRNPDPSLVREVLQPEKTCLPVFDFETGYWIDSPAETSGIVLVPGSRVIEFLKKVVPEETRELIQLEKGEPVLYDVKTKLKCESVSSVKQIKENPDQYRGKVVGFPAKGYGGGISIQEAWEGQPPCGKEKVRIKEACADILVDARLEGLVAWNELSLPPKRVQVLLTAGASSIHQDKPYQGIKGKFRFVGKILSTKKITKKIDKEFPEGLALVIYKKVRTGDIDYEKMAKSAKKDIENKVRKLNFGLTGFSKKPLPEIPVQSPITTAGTPEEIPETIPVVRSASLKIQSIKPEIPVEIGLTKSTVQKLRFSTKNAVSGVEISIEKLASLPPEVKVEPRGKVYKLVEISAKNLLEKAIKKAGINFWVPKEWLSTQGVGKEDVMLQRYHGGEWKKLPTKIIEETDTRIRYSAETSGFSTFAITATVKAPSFSVTNLSISKETIKPGESTNISVDVQNTGDAEGTHEVELSVNGEVVKSKSVTLSPNEAKTVSFTVSREDIGTYNVTVDNRSGSFKVMRPKKKPAGDINGDGEIGLEDLAILASVYGKTSEKPDFLPKADLNEDSKVGLEDLAILGKNWGKRT